MPGVSDLHRAFLFCGMFEIGVAFERTLRYIPIMATRKKQKAATTTTAPRRERKSWQAWLDPKVDAALIAKFEAFQQSKRWSASQAAKHLITLALQEMK